MNSFVGEKIVQETLILKLEHQQTLAEIKVLKIGLDIKPDKLLVQRFDSSTDLIGV